MLMRLLKNTMLNSILCLILFYSAQSQTTDPSKLKEGSNVYIKINAGYGILTPGAYRLISETTSFGAPVNVTTSKGLGFGLKYGGGLGIILNDFLNIGVDAEFIPMTTINATYMGASATETIDDRSQISYSSISIIPNITFKALSKPDYLIYTKIGIVLNLPNDLKQQYNDTTYYNDGVNSYGYRSVDNKTFKMNLNAGINVALGIQVRLTAKMRAFAEMFANYTALTPKNSVETNDFKENSISPTPSKTGEVNFTNLTYIKNGTIQPAVVTPTPGYPQTSPDGYYQTSSTYTETTLVTSFIFRLNAIGINIGVAYRF
jgi:hypothetical protein